MGPPLTAPTTGTPVAPAVDVELTLSIAADVDVPAAGALVLDDVEDVPDDDAELVKHDVSEPSMTVNVFDKNICPRLGTYASKV